MKTQQSHLNGYGIGIDLGGSKIELVLSKDDPLNIVLRKREPCDKHNGYEALLSQIVRLTKEALDVAGESKVSTIGMGIPGSINPQTQLVRNCNITMVNGKAMEKDLSRLLNRPFFIGNDANCFTLSEAILGAGEGHQNVLGIILGTGLGGGIVMQQKIYQGKDGYAAELGHTSIDYNGVACWCGNKGCVENYLSGTGIELIYRQHSTKQNTEQNGESIKAPLIYERYQQGEAAAIATFRDYFIYFGRALSNFIYMFNPDIIVLGGGASHIPALYTEGKEAVLSHFQQEKIDIQIVPNKLSDSSGVYGALLMALEQDT